jgi:hypothetical protein
MRRYTLGTSAISAGFDHFRRIACEQPSAWPIARRSPQVEGGRIERCRPSCPSAPREHGPPPRQRSARTARGWRHSNQRDAPRAGNRDCRTPGSRGARVMLHIRPRVHVASIRTLPCISGPPRWCQDSARQGASVGPTFASRLSATECRGWQALGGAPRSPMHSTGVRIS